MLFCSFFKYFFTLQTKTLKTIEIETERQGNSYNENSNNKK